MIRLLLDTNVCIRLIRDRPRGLALRLDRIPGEAVLSTVVLMELRFGADKSARPEFQHGLVDQLAQRLELLTYDAAAAAHSGEIRATLDRRGLRIGPYDLMIAGHARSRGLIVVTGNLREFNRVDGLRAEDWTEPAA